MPRPALVVSTISLLLCSALACKDEPSEPASATAEAPREVASEPAAEPEPPPEPPRWLLLPWDTKLRVAPEQYAPALTLAPPPKPETEEAEGAAKGDESPGRVVKVLGKADEEGRWWKLDAGAPLDPGVAGRAIEGLDFYELALYVPAGTGKAFELEPKPEPEPKPATTRVAAEPRAGAGEQAGILGVLAASSPVPVQSARARPAGLEHEWVVKVESKVYWSDGSLAGRVARTHAFLEAGETREVGGRELSCFGVRIGPPKQPVTELCFEPGAVSMAVPVVSPFGDANGWGELDEIGEARGLVGLGMGGTGVSNTKADGGSGIGKIGEGAGGHGSGSDGEGQGGIGGFGGRGDADEARP
jgi:hypothetical protein